MKLQTQEILAEIEAARAGDPGIYHGPMRWICKLLRRHFPRKEFGGGADCLICTVCGARKVLRIYGYDKPDVVYENPQWSYE